MKFIELVTSLGCLPQLIIASGCLVAMTGLVTYGVVSVVKEINNA